MKGISAWHNELTWAWWSWAKNEDNLDRAPQFLRPLILGEVKRVEASQKEIDAAMVWAESIEGWHPLPPESKPLVVHDEDHPSTSQESPTTAPQDDDRR